MTLPLMPKATAVWLVENTSLTFTQIADFCGMHSLEVQAIADGDVAANIMGLDPIAGGQLTAEEIKRCEKDPDARLELFTNPEIDRLINKGARYVSQAKKMDRPMAILWLVKNHPELSDRQIVRLLKTTKPTILSIRNKTHKNYHNIQATSPVTLGLCSESDLNTAVACAVKQVK